MLRTTSSDKDFPSEITGRTALGCVAFCISLFISFKRIEILTILIPPPVDPAQPPKIIRIIKINFEKLGHNS